MCAEIVETGRIALEGDWSMGGIASQFTEVMQRVAEVTSGEAKPLELELNLAGIAALDACGCQLLARVARTLRLSGIPTGCSGLPAPFLNKIRILGFQAELGCGCPASGESL